MHQQRLEAVRMLKRSMLKMMLGFIVLAVALPASGGGEHTVMQKDFAFSTKEVRVRAGERIVFINADPVPHNVYSLTKGLEFEIRSQLPGKSDTVPFPSTGTAEVRCAIHPKMKLTVHVAP
jgi:plastocyanin